MERPDGGASHAQRQGCRSHFFVRDGRIRWV
ncbi:DUF6527 family protein [Acidovorax sp. MR-S7]